MSACFVVFVAGTFPYSKDVLGHSQGEASASSSQAHCVLQGVHQEVHNCAS